MASVQTLVQLNLIEVYIMIVSTPIVKPVTNGRKFERAQRYLCSSKQRHHPRGDGDNGFVIDGVS
jgi:hypothetical protein